MAWVMSVLGAALALGGGYALWTGSGYIRLDWGQAETVAGTVALSAGIVTVGLAAVLFALRDLARAPARLAASGVGLEAMGRGDGTEPSLLSTRGQRDVRPATAGTSRAERIEPAAMAPLPAQAIPGPDRDVDEPFTDAPALGAPAASPPDPAFANATVAQEASHSAVPLPLAEAPTVVGRYEANGASYVLFSDGTIEVETESGTHRFDSMDHLREHIGRQDAG